MKILFLSFASHPPFLEAGISDGCLKLLTGALVILQHRSDFELFTASSSILYIAFFQFKQVSPVLLFSHPRSRFPPLSSSLTRL